MLSKKYADVTDVTIKSAMTQNCKDLSQRTAVGRNSKMGKIMNDIINLIKENSMCSIKNFVLKNPELYWHCYTMQLASQ